MEQSSPKVTESRLGRDNDEDLARLSDLMLDLLRHHGVADDSAAGRRSWSGRGPTRDSRRPMRGPGGVPPAPPLNI